MSGWHDKAPPGPMSAAVLVVAVLVGIGMILLGIRVLTSTGLQSPVNAAVSDRIGRVFLVPGAVDTLAALGALLLRRRRPVVARGLMVTAAIALLVGGLVVIVGVVAIPMLLTGAGLLVAAFTDEEPGPKIRWEGR
ncbi:hypothetical protein [Nocardioides massiliensis]|uniref:Integral membrane protein n=1 Tax=Nocardioides massiliensis TaxID=1325935 RepID=A0ABT9NTJ6_9ACTN|nr:hypothetical protein [Nocardioides massiliensis]MDP9823749.1 hypothetical protein [Nocardioides massiliensis]